jgi:hypothetical protein
MLPQLMRNYGPAGEFPVVPWTLQPFYPSEVKVKEAKMTAVQTASSGVYDLARQVTKR